MHPSFDKQFVNSLPITSVKTGDQVIRVRYDRESGYLFRLDENDQWTGEITRKPQKPNSAAQSDLPEAEPMDLENLTSHQKAQEDQNAQKPEKSTSKETAEDITDSKKDDAELLNKPASEIPDSDQVFTANDTKDSEQEESQEQQNKNKHSFKDLMKITAIAAVILLAVWAAFVTMLGDEGNEKNEVQINNPTIETTPPPTVETAPIGTEEIASSEVPATTQTEPQICVLTANFDLIPGTVITEDCFSPAQLTEMEYRQLSTSTGLYIQEDLTNLTGLVTVTYIPNGRYLTYDDVATVYEPQNPWTVSDNEEMVVLPVSIMPENMISYGWGYHSELSITVQTKQTNDNTATETEDAATPPSGLEHESSVVEAMVVDTYKLQNVQIIDLLNANQESLYSRYIALSEIPSAFLRSYLEEHYAAGAVMDLDIPYYICISVTPEQSAVLSALDTSAMTVEIQNSQAHNITALQNEQSRELQEVIGVIADIALNTVKEVS